MRKLKQISRNNNYFNIYDDSCIEEQYLSSEDRARRTALLDRIYGSNLIFNPDEEFSHISDDIPPCELCAIASELSSIREKIVQKKSEENSRAKSTSLEALHLNIKTWAILNSAGITTIPQLQALSFDNLSSIKGLGANRIHEIKEKLADFVNSNNTPEILTENSAKPSTELERLKLIKTLSSIKAAKLKEQINSAQKKLESLSLTHDESTNYRGE